MWSNISPYQQCSDLCLHLSLPIAVTGILIGLLDLTFLHLTRSYILHSHITQSYTRYGLLIGTVFMKGAHSIFRLQRCRNSPDGASSAGYSSPSQSCPSLFGPAVLSVPTASSGPGASPRGKEFQTCRKTTYKHTCLRLEDSNHRLVVLESHDWLLNRRYWSRRLAKVHLEEKINTNKTEKLLLCAGTATPF